VQGCWLDWPRLQRELRASVADLLPQAELQPADAAPSPDDERRLAALPIRLVPGPTAEVPNDDTPTPSRWSLIGAWVSVVVAAVSVAALLAGVMTLSERRRIFVSAVTHELRTPLTTFRLYTEMMDTGMVSGEEKRREYVSRLRAEAERLGHLVENVLFYARLEGGRAGAMREKVDLRGFLRELSDRLRERAQRAGMELVIDEDEGIGAVDARIDRSAVEQILLNLVDNACKYAASATLPRIEIRLGRRADRAVIRVRDHGPGISKADRRRLFRPFSKSDREAATSAPGVGLGLALSRRLARAQGGDLRVDDSVTDGAAFLLTLPAA
jgi:signal transduction histidine kinase